MKQRLFFALFFALIAIPLIAFAGTLTMTTYYPKPTAAYDAVTANAIGVGTTSVGDHLTVANNVSIGEGCANYGSIGLAGDKSCVNYNITSSPGADLFINRPNAHVIHFKLSNNVDDQMTLQTSGNVGIDHAGDIEKLAVNGHMVLSSANPNLYFGGSSTYLGYPSANTIAFYTASTEQMRLNSTGLGIGAAPAFKLDVNGTTNIFGSGTMANATITTFGNITSNITTANITTANTTTANFLNNATITDANVAAPISVTLNSTLTGPTLITAPITVPGLGTFNGGVTVGLGSTFNVLLGIATFSNSVGIGAVATPPYRLYIDGDLGIDGDMYDIAGDYKYGPAPSDEKLKENICPIKNALVRTKRLNGVTFDWKKNKKRSVGLIAQNVEKTFPELVYTDKRGMKNIQYPNLVGVLIEDIKDQQQQLDTLQQETDAMRKKIQQ